MVLLSAVVPSGVHEPVYLYLNSLRPIRYERVPAGAWSLQRRRFDLTKRLPRLGCQLRRHNGDVAHCKEKNLNCCLRSFQVLTISAVLFEAALRTTIRCVLPAMAAAVFDAAGALVALPVPRTHAPLRLLGPQVDLVWKTDAY